MMHRHRIIDTPTGSFVIWVDEADSLHTDWIKDDRAEELESSTADSTLHSGVVSRLEAYFQGEPVYFFDVPTPDGPRFFRDCWEACRRIPRGETRSYRELAEMAGGKPGSARAAGQAMKRNRLPVIIPCHRVIGADGGLHGFAGTDIRGSDALGRKEHLLVLEGCLVNCV